MKKEIKSKYVIDYVWPTDVYGHQSFYHQLVRIADNAIIYANSSLDCVELECWKRGICKQDVTIL